MLPWIDFNLKEIYCSNVSACGIKFILTIAAFYKLRMRGGDLVRAYLVTRANNDYPFNQDPPGLCIQAAGNLHDCSHADENFSTDFDACVKETG